MELDFTPGISIHKGITFLLNFTWRLKEPDTIRTHMKELINISKKMKPKLKK